jgi:hypothetical protein
LSSRDTTELTVVLEADNGDVARHLLGKFDTKGEDVAMCAESFRLVAAMLDPREEHFRIPSHHHGRSPFLVTGRFTGRCPELVDRLVFFGPIAQRQPSNERIRLPAWRLISLADQWNRFTETLPPGEPPVLLRRHFDEWGECYLDIDPESRTRSPAAVKVPSGAFQDIYDAWAGELAYDPGLVRAPV